MRGTISFASSKEWTELLVPGAASPRQWTESFLSALVGLEIGLLILLVIHILHSTGKMVTKYRALATTGLFVDWRKPGNGVIVPIGQK